MKVLIIEDEKELLSNILKYLGNENYICETASDYATADEKIFLNDYDCIIVDIMLPDGSGLDLLEQIKEKDKNTGIIIISAKNSLDDKLYGLEKGSDDYLTKPFHLSELNARIKAILRRRQTNGQNTIEVNEIKLNIDLEEVYVNGEKVDLTLKEYQMLYFFVLNKDKVIRKQSIVERLWPDEYDFNSYDFIYVHLTNLRKKLSAKGCKDYIKTVYGIGYKFLVEE
ncbi:MAG: response regulator transcription factor [Bacteroidales bacterium]|jgi:DNA-binding response OmpR family regulator|nr:response regulator transcription factor [Bacteroidales bacterium]